MEPGVISRPCIFARNEPITALSSRPEVKNMNSYVTMSVREKRDVLFKKKMWGKSFLSPQAKYVCHDR